MAKIKGIERMDLLTGEDADFDTNDDVRTYLDHSFDEMRRTDKSILKDWPDYDTISKLVCHTGGVFKWAAVAIASVEKAEGERVKRLTAIVDQGTTYQFDDFDSYLEDILDPMSEEIPPDDFQATVGTIAFSLKSLKTADLEHFLQSRFTSGATLSLEDTCYQLLPIISIDPKTKTVKIRHKAYRDYLIDSKRCTLFDSEFRGKTHRKMAISCLKIMQQGLKFNICGLESSYQMNNEIKEKDALVDKYIPSHLAYACQYWADHLHGMASAEKRDTEIVNLLRNFLNVHLLHWLEALSLLSISGIASKSLSKAAEWLEVCESSSCILMVTVYEAF
jgi:hypothetical protein